MPKKLLTEEDCLKIGKVLNSITNRCNKAKPVKPSKPAKPAKPAKKVAEPNAKPVKPSKPAKPAKPVKPAKPAKLAKKVVEPKAEPVKPVKKLLTEEDCLKIGKVLNPKTNRCNIVKNIKKSISPKVRSRSPMAMSSSRKRKVDAFMKKRATKIIQKFTSPFINRVSANIDDRIRTYKLYHKYLSKYNKKQCLKVSKTNNEVTYSLANDNVKIVKQIGSYSEFGVVYLSKGTNTGELFRFASKIINSDGNDNIAEANMLEKLTKLVIEKKNPHFPIMYYNFNCSKPESNIDLPYTINNKKYDIIINELANGDAKMFLHQHHANGKKVNNALTQIFISIYSFHCAGYIHNDTHWGNFLYHKIKSGGYIKYIINGKELYLENIGYLWVIWDFGNNVSKNENKMHYITQDYKEILGGFDNVNNDGYLPDELKYSSATRDLVYGLFYSIDDFRENYESGGNISSAFFNRFIRVSKEFLKKADLPKDAIIINNSNPYKIGI
jgi:hypothetical protein